MGAFILVLLLVSCGSYTTPSIDRTPDAAPPPDALYYEYPQPNQVPCDTDDQCVSKHCLQTQIPEWRFCTRNCYSLEGGIIYLCNRAEEVCVGDSNGPWDGLWCYRECFTPFVQDLCPDGQFCYFPPGYGRGYCWLGDPDDYRSEAISQVGGIEEDLCRHRSPDDSELSVGD